MDTIDPDTGSEERQGFESSFALQCIVGLYNVNKQLSN